MILGNGGSDGKMEKGLNLVFEKDEHVASLLPEDGILFSPWSSTNNKIVLRNIAGKKKLWQMDLGKDWYCSQIGLSQNSKFAAFKIDDNTYHCPKPTFHISVFDVLKEKITSKITFVGEHYGELRTVVPSNDGKYVALGGLDNKLNIVDTETKKTLWAIYPKGAISMVYCAFSPDSQLVFGGGGGGCLYGFDVKTGEMKYQFWASLSGKSEYGHRISSIAVSPDGKYVAAGTGPEGLVFVYSIEENKLIGIYDHGMTTILVVAFSPDSRYIASFAGGLIKTWQIGNCEPAETK